MGISVQPVTIANAASLSGAAFLEGYYLVGIMMPAAWTAANLTFQGSHDGVTFYDVYDSAGIEVVVNAAASRFIVLVPGDYAGMRHLKVRSGTTGSAVNQGAARTLFLLLRHEA